jgi:hypothetical protein
VAGQLLFVLETRGGKEVQAVVMLSLHGVAPFFLFLLFINLFVCFDSFILPRIIRNILVIISSKLL